uniref:Nebulette n=1 Tax=Oryzias melastigma TaxID=30732 RepID=A0A3B3BIM4_ORYME
MQSSLFSQLPETAETQFVREMTEMLSEVRLCTELLFPSSFRLNILFIKYKEAGKREALNCLYSKLPETLETRHAKEVSQLQSQVGFYKEKYNREKGKADYTNMKTLPDVQHAMAVTKNQSEVSYRKGKEELHHCNTAPDRPDILNAANATKLASDVAYKNQTKQPVYSDSSLLTRTDIQHANEVSKLTSQVKYKENFHRHLKDQKPSYNPLDCLTFRHTQAAAALASQVEYKKKYELAKAHYHIAVDTAEQLHHKETAVLHSQVKYREEYEKSKGRSQMEFGETPAYKVSKEVQKIQSEKEYRKDYEEQVKGKALVDVDQTPGYLTARHASSLLSEVLRRNITPTHSKIIWIQKAESHSNCNKEYKKDLEQEVKGRGLSGVGLEETPELLRVKKANQILNQVADKEYRKDLERDILGKGMELSPDVLEMRRVKRASEIQSQV